MNPTRTKAALACVALAFAAGNVPAQQQQQTQRPLHRHKLTRVPEPARPVPGGGPQFGDPLDGLTAAQQQAFASGREEFESIETPEGGLGPIFNDNSCAACHSLQTSGGAGTTTVTRFGRRLNGQFDALAALGGSLLQRFAISPKLLEHLPAEANVVAKRQTTPLFGAGLIEAIPDAEIELNALRRKPDGIHGRPSRVLDVATKKMRIGRFGWKAQHAGLLSFAGDAYLNEMGITNRFFPTENAPNGNMALITALHLPPGIEDTVDPATGRSDIDAAADFMRFLAPPPTLRRGAPEIAGQRLFEQLQCAACHVPSMQTGPSPIAAIAFRPAFLYSDLLLHDMGRLGDGIEQGTASGREMRTAPLWGLRARAPYLHDGRAPSVRAAIEAHDGEGAGARARFKALSDTDVQQLLAFLRTL